MFRKQFTESARSCVSLRFTPRSKSKSTFPLTAYVYQRIMSYAASQIRPFESWPHLRGLTFTEPEPSSHHQIHLLFGADIYGCLFICDLRNGPIETLTAQLTALGWILSDLIRSGRFPSSLQQFFIVCWNLIQARSSNAFGRTRRYRSRSLRKGGVMRATLCRHARSLPAGP